MIHLHNQPVEGLENRTRRQKLLQMQALPLEQKIEATKRRIREWLDVYPDAKVAFSGGKDSTVLLHIARQISSAIVASFANTGLEYPEIVEFVNQTPNVVTVRPKMDFLSVVQRYGYLVVSKEVALYLHEGIMPNDTPTRTLRRTGVLASGESRRRSMVPEKWKFLLNAGLKIGNECCTVMKKNPMKDSPHAIIGTMASDGEQRLQSYYRFGCNAFTTSRPQSRPLSFWTKADVWEYIHSRNLPYSRIYDMGYSRTGCMFCMFGLHMEGHPNRFERMAITHPRLFKYCMDGPLGLRAVIRTVYKMEMPS